MESQKNNELHEKTPKVKNNAETTLDNVRKQQNVQINDIIEKREVPLPSFASSKKNLLELWDFDANKEMEKLHEMDIKKGVKI